MSRRLDLRLGLLLTVIALWAVAIGWKLSVLQVSDHEEYRARAQKQQRTSVDLEPPRGTVYDARGRELAVSVEVDSAWADPRRVRAEADPGEVALAIAELTGADPEVLAARLASDREFVFLARQLDLPQAQAVADLGIPGVSFVKEYKRYYPMGELAAQVIGYAGIDQQGLAGLEHLYENRVAGREGSKTLLRDAGGRTAATPFLASTGAAARPGASLHLTLDATIQRIAERELVRGVESSSAARGSVVILDPGSGAILAMASYPPLDANRFPEFYGTERTRNLPVTAAYEPGSTFKMVTAAAALTGNVLDPTDELECQMGAIELYGVRIRDHHPFGRLSLRQVIAKSSNVGAIKTGLAAGDEGLFAAVEAFGFGHTTGVDLPGENPGELAPLENWRRWPLTKAYVSFGQGISVTPLQLTRAFAAVANGGELLRPYVVEAVTAADGDAVERTERLVDGRPVSAATARELERMLEAVVTEGTGKRAAVPGYAVAGKTGTAQKAVDGAYSATKFVASFTGFVPARRPALVMTVVIDEPWPRYHGGDVAAPVFSAIAEPVLLYLGVPPDAEADPDLPRFELAQAVDAGGPPA
ncbi:MAG TPA: penicillin-binding protein 2 [Thermoanaerobaculia bacterium]|nr:penicillin-binding protein 2 [Thermoanaerobaculia bacterium]